MSDPATSFVDPLPPFRARITLRSADDTAALAARMAPVLAAGDTLLLMGDLGAGKTHFARALIQTRLAVLSRVEDVPSPSFTLIQTYDAGELEIWHADLYRLTDAAEIVELGLEDALETALCLVEWPDRAAAIWPERAVWLHFEYHPKDDEARILSLHAAQTAPTVERLVHIMSDHDRRG